MNESDPFKKYGLHRPPIIRIISSKVLGLNILPEHIADHPQKLMDDYPELRGDKTTIGWGDDGGCPSY